MRKIVFFTLALLLAVPAAAATYFPSRTDFRDEQIYFLLPTRFYDGDPTNNTQCWDNQYLYTGANKNNIAATTKITAICETTDMENLQSPISNVKLIINGHLYIQAGDKRYDATGRLITTDASGILPAQ